MDSAAPPLWRLPTNVSPEKYTIEYDAVDLRRAHFAGVERIELAIHAATRSITCHAVALYVHSVSLELLPSGASDANADAAARTIACCATRFSQVDETVRFEFAEELPAHSRGVLHLRFQGDYNNDEMNGLFTVEYDGISSRESATETKRVMAVTDFEPCFARRAFVCWDEPAAKARFAISIATHVEMTALSNMHVTSTQVRARQNAAATDKQDGGREVPMEKLWIFAETPRMSTYLVAIAVGEFDVLTALTSDNVLVNVYAPLGQSHRCEFPLRVATQALAFFTKQFDIPYPMKKLDFVTVMGFDRAMENWGLVTCTDRGLLIDEATTSQACIVQAAKVICHEVAHQWFGNLVTMEWWDGLWLNEGFAQYMENSAVHAIFPEWHIWDMFVQDIALGSAFTMDSMLSSHPIEATVNKSSEVEEIFDAISYQKGASVVRMLVEFLGFDAFYAGVHNYLVTHAYHNTTPDDLWAALEQASGQRITQMANSWIKQTGYPVVTLEKCIEGNGYRLTQQRFLQDPDANSTDATVWDLPLAVLTASKSDEPTHIGMWNATSGANKANERKTPIVAPESINAQLSALAASSSWIKLNPHHTGFYLVNYPADMWTQLKHPVRSCQLSVADRMSLISSVFRLARAGLLCITKALEFVQAYSNDPSFICWREISRNIEQLDALASRESFYPEFQAYVRDLYLPCLRRLTWDPTEEDKHDSNTSQFRAIVISRLGDAGDADVINEARKRCEAYLTGNKRMLPADFRSIAFGLFAKSGSQKHIEHVVAELKKLYESSSMTEEKMIALRGLASVEHASVKQSVLTWGFQVLPPYFLRALFLRAVATERDAVIVWTFIKKNYKELSTKLSAIDVGEIICSTVEHFRCEDHVTDVKNFMASKTIDGFQRLFNEALERVRLNAKEVECHRDALASWLKTRALP